MSRGGAFPACGAVGMMELRAERRGSQLVALLRSRPPMLSFFARQPIRRWDAIALALTGLFCARAACGQTSYYNLDSGRPTRVEDAIATTLGELEIQVLPLRGEWVSDGTQRIRVEPKLSYGVLPLTEIELRVPFVTSRSPGSAETAGIASAGVSALHAFNVETRWPALAVAAEVVLPVGSLSAKTASYSVKGLATKTFRFARLELNAGGGTWSIRPPTAAATGGGGTLCGNAPGVPPCLIPDVPCNVVPSGLSSGPSFACMPAAAPVAIAAAATPASSGAHWMAGLGVDHTFPLVSTLIIADIVVDRFVGLYPLDDWTAEIGLRKQFAPQLVVDLGFGRHFAGTTQGTSVTVGMSYSTPLWIP